MSTTSVVVHQVNGTHASADRQPGPILPSTLAPEHCAAGTISRPRLLAALTRGVTQTPVTLLSAAAGSGKTVLAASWAKDHSAGWSVGWLTVDSACADSASFWRCLAEVLTRNGVDLRDVEPPNSGDAVSTSFLIGVTAAVLDLSCPIVLVLDCTDRSLTADVGAGLDFLVRHAHPRFRLVICTRADPMLPVHKYRLADSVTELRQDALAFTAAETEQLFAIRGLPLSREIAHTLTEVTEGWAAGLHLAAASVQHGADPATLSDSLAREGGSVAEYLSGEVLAAQPPQVRRLLLQTSICERLTPELVAHLTGRTDGRRMLDALVHANAFVQRCSGPDGGYRVHPLLRELLKAELGYELPHQVARLHSRCADWFAGLGQYRVAAEHAGAAGDWQHAAALLVEALAVASLLAEDESTYARSIESMPTGLAGDEAALLRVARQLGRGQHIADEDRARVARVAERGGDNGALRVSAAVVHCAARAAGAETVADLACATELTAAAERLVRGYADPDRQPQIRQLAAIVQIARATCALKAEGGAAVDAWADALEACKAAQGSRLQRTGWAGLALAEALRGELLRATECSRAAERLADECGVARARRPGAAPLALAWVACEAHQVAEARRWATLAAKSADDYAGSLLGPLDAVLHARLLRSRRDVVGAETMLESAPLPVDSPVWLHERRVGELAAVRVARRNAGAAMAAVDALPDPHSATAELLRTGVAACGAGSRFEIRAAVDDAAAPLDMRVDAWLYRAGLHLHGNNVAMAVTAVTRALELAAPQRLRRPFLDPAPGLRALLRADPALRNAAGWLTGSPGPASRSPQRAGTAVPADLPPVETLTERELEVLRLLSAQLSTDEIGAAMFVSVNTVRTHVRSILRKLAVTRRNQAVRRARELELV